MTRSRRALLLCAVAAALPARAGPPGRAVPRLAARVRGPLVTFHRERLPDGMELVVLPVRFADAASMRVVVRAGSDLDPPGRAGLAHLLEHLIAGPRAEDALLDLARAAGAELNAYTTRDTTCYELDAPADAFRPLAARLLREVTGPPLRGADLAREQGVISGEEAYHGGGEVLPLVEEVLFRTGDPAPIGAPRTRDEITRADLAAFFRANYATTNMTVVVAGAITLEDARALVDSAVLLPPALPGEAAAPRAGLPLLPANEPVRAPLNATVLGYALEPGEPGTCEALAALLELRLLVTLQLEDPVLGGVGADCRVMRGVPFVLATAFSRSLDAGDLPPQIDEVFRKAKTRPMTLAEREILERRRGRTLDWVRDDPALLADAVAGLAAGPRPGDATPVEELERPLPPGGKLRETAVRSFSAGRRVQIEFSPFRQ